ncbi:MAG: dTMP kinase [Candidatus Pacebacteria bacterium RIFCSPHIGHO2_01_FULL_46_16]|nr:MAG: dTMP kinase [Candidatus Pacebacteria bacterium RIFCSPHIGHO2_01_FULL_46_16]OGJ38688.1 MAG: dTMP kinase [Candidatus Pacebacteria bacterium RIFCSPLOWO2_01_FULL_47_12]
MATQNDFAPGLLITLEGGEGGGKTTQIVRLRDKLTALGKDVIALREPGGTTVSEQIREVVLSAKNAGMAYTTEVLLFQAARAQIYREIVLPSLAAGKVVLMDRSRDSSIVYQGIVRGFGRELIDQLNDISTKHTLPNLTLLLDVPVEEGLARVATAGNNNRMEMQGREFHEKVRQAYLDLAKADTTGRWQIIDASKPLEEVEHAVWQVVEQVIQNTFL